VRAARLQGAPELEAGVICVVTPEGSPWLAGRLSRVEPGSASLDLTPRMLLGLRVVHRAWVRGDAGRRVQARFAVRRLADWVAAHRLPRACRLVVAPGGAAEHTFAVARSRGVPTLLVHDLPVLRRLHDDLDAAARRHPDAALLRRHRASPAEVARQEAEWVLADRVAPMGAFARAALLDAGLPEDKLVAWDDPSVAPRRPRPPGAPCRVLLAGLATTRSGTREAVEALADLRDVELLVRAGDGLDPPDLLRRPRVRAASTGERLRLEGVHAVVAPAWCESYPPEVALAARLGVPVVATARAAGAVDLGRAGVEVAPGDRPALRRAIASFAGAQAR